MRNCAGVKYSGTSHARARAAAAACRAIAAAAIARKTWYVNGRQNARTQLRAALRPRGRAHCRMISD
eukprot:5377952-Prymnesium_polylepis.1